MKSVPIIIPSKQKEQTSALITYLAHAKRDIAAGKSACDVLPLLFKLRGVPFSLKWSHFMFEPMYRFNPMPRRMIWRTARQVSKSTSLAASQVLLAASVPYFNVLTVTPFYEQVRKFSQNYVKPFIDTAPFSETLFKSSDTTNAVLQRTMRNGSSLFYSYSSGDPSRCRGISATGGVSFDETQDLDLADLPIIESCMAASQYKIWRAFGTPKTFDNTIEQLWQDSSQAAWNIPCQNSCCHYTNRCNTDNDLLKMMGDTTLICAKCGKPVDSRLGYWHHEKPELQLVFPGYHVPQPILPMHYEKPKDWNALKTFQRTKPKFALMNEVLGESFDTGSKMLTQDELRAAACIPRRNPDDYEVGKYISTVVGVDWGGRGKEKTTDTDEFISNTAIAAASMLPEGIIEIPYLFRVPYEMNHKEETRLVARVAKDVRADWLAMDYGGQGNVLEEMVKAHGWPQEMLCPFTYAVMPRQRPIVHYKPPKAYGVRSSYTLDKPRSLLLLCELIKVKQVVFANDAEWVANHLQDFMNIYLESTEDPRGSPRKLVKRMSRRTDDVVHAVNFAVMGLFQSLGRWPALASAFIDGGAQDEDDEEHDYT